MLGEGSPTGEENTPETAVHSLRPGRLPRLPKPAFPQVTAGEAGQGAHRGELPPRSGGSLAVVVLFQAGQDGLLDALA